MDEAKAWWLTKLVFRGILIFVAIKLGLALPARQDAPRVHEGARANVCIDAEIGDTAATAAVDSAWRAT